MTKQDFNGHTDAPTNNGIKELDGLCEKYNNGKLNISQLVCSIWNVAIYNEDLLAENVRLREGLAKLKDKADYLSRSEREYVLDVCHKALQETPDDRT